MNIHLLVFFVLYVLKHLFCRKDSLIFIKNAHVVLQNEMIEKN